MSIFLHSSHNTYRILQVGWCAKDEVVFPSVPVAGGNRSICGPQERMLILLSFYVSLFGHASLALSASGALSEVCANCSWRTQCLREVYVQRNLQMHESMISSWWLGRLAMYI